jgi:hypothetical protein
MIKLRMGLASIVVLTLAISLQFKPQEKIIQPQPPIIPQIDKKTEFFATEFKKRNSPVPYDMAIAVTKTIRPVLYTSLSIEESDGDPKAIGDGGKSIGAFQIQPQHYGPVPKHIDGQAQKAQVILEGLIKENKGRLRISLAKYNGGDRPPKQSFAYADRILKRTKEIHKRMKEENIKLS